MPLISVQKHSKRIESDLLEHLESRQSEPKVLHPISQDFEHFLLSAATVGKQREEAAISTVTGERDLNTTVRIKRERVNKRVNKRAKEFHERQKCDLVYFRAPLADPGPSISRMTRLTGGRG